MYVCVHDYVRIRTRIKKCIHARVYVYAKDISVIMYTTISTSIHLYNEIDEFVLPHSLQMRMRDEKANIIALYSQIIPSE